MARFEHRHGLPDKWYPNYGGIDWETRHSRSEAGMSPPVVFDSQDGLLYEINQENSAFYMSRVAPEMDMLAVEDPRDGQEYCWFRDEVSIDFEDALKLLGRCALFHTSEYPLEAVVDVYLRRKETGIDMEFLNGETD